MKGHGNMAKIKTIDAWNMFYGNKEEVHDYAGKLMKKSACGNPNSKFHPTLDHIRPLSLGGKDVIENLVIVHRDTNAEKGNHFPHWKVNGLRFHARKVKGKSNQYEIVREK